MRLTDSIQRIAMVSVTPSRASKACVAALLIASTLVISACARDEQPVAAVASEGARTGEAKWDRRDFNGMWLVSSVDSHSTDLETDPSQSESDPSEDFGFDTLPQLKGDYLQANQRGNASVTCKPGGLPVLLAAPYATEILQNEKQINWFQEFPGETWRIYLDDRSHPNPEEYPATLHGHSTGQWDGDTLVVDSVNLRTDTLLYGQGRADGQGHSEKMHAVHRISLVDRDHLQIQGTIEDPEALVSPWQYTLTYHRHPNEEVVEYLCDDNNYDFWDAKTGQEVTEIPARRNLPKPAAR